MKFKLILSRLFKNKITQYDFYPNHIAIIEKPYSPYVFYIVMTLSLGVIAFIIWAYLGKLDVQAPATGKLIVSGHSQLIQIYEHSRLAAIHVEEGQHVSKGDPLLTLDILGIEEEISGLKNKIDNLLLLKIRYQALSEKHSPTSIYHFNNLNDDDKKSILISYKKEKEEFEATVNQINNEIDINHKNQLMIKYDITSISTLKKNTEKRFNIKKSLYDKKVLSKMDFLESEKELLEIARQLKIKTSEYLVLVSQGKQLNENIDKLEKQKALEWHDKYKQYESEVLIYQQNLNHAQKRQQLKIVKAPVTGTVQQISVHTLGAVLQPSQAVMAIIPNDKHNIAQVNILNKDVGFIHLGQKAIIKIDAFPYTRYGTLEGKVINIAKDSVEHEQLGLVYPALIELDKQSIGIANEQYKLAVGMSLVADVIIDKRRVIDYLLSPIEAYSHKALREK
ncbi:HlyD family type I secretion periplasmic adaptor subunit [Proteus myxofaciens]|uniref:Membrane fusion protein (MFP) family protein n=1 Tax=Proteus myxofaciens ATCC 19692 TaxID=1354337 RepID=A0A198GBX8_9GAMM|nr:HlyD family type I secretion periplasmic adaptor subunit [Proteus myxofaciens]OAT34942.1 hemolysin secretion protein D, plasmid [Proteus myxofaciens ATCC 19692]